MLAGRCVALNDIDCTRKAVVFPPFLLALTFLLLFAKAYAAIGEYAYVFATPRLRRIRDTRA
jgi:hypothetical protein